GKRVRELRLHSPVEEREFSQDKLTVYDLRLSDQGARQYLLEMQRLGLWFFPKRALFYGSSAYSRQLQSGEEYLTLQPVFVVCLMVKGWKEKAACHEVYELRQRGDEGVIADLELHFIDLSKFEVPLDKVQTALQRWCAFFNHALELGTDIGAE